jgi:hypothetical protein
LAREAGELAANYQEAVKGVLTLSRPRRWGARSAALDFLRGNRHLAAAAKAALAARTANSRFEDPANKGNCLFVRVTGAVDGLAPSFGTGSSSFIPAGIKAWFSKIRHDLGA